MKENIIKIAMAQINPTLGKLDSNIELIKTHIMEAEKKSADLIIFPELAISGYLPQDLLFDKTFINANKEALKTLTAYSQNIHIIVGHLHEENGQLYNTAAHLFGGSAKHFVKKSLLPTYDVFDEQRYFKSAESIEPISINIRGKDIKLGIEICEDLWDEDYETKVTNILAKKGAEVFINISASPFSSQKARARTKLVKSKCNTFHIPFIYNNLVGAQDELIYDGNSFVLDHNGHSLLQMPAFREKLDFIDLNLSNSNTKTMALQSMDDMEEMFLALSLGISDYFKKSGFHQCIIGLSGGIDSALVAALATNALGAKNVFAYSLPSHFSSEHSKDDAYDCAENLGINYETIAIEPIYKSYMTDLETHFEGLPFGLAEENLQARIRGTLLMSLSNKFDRLLLSTANKTEAALGYSTLYGDMAGALSPIIDLNKLEVYKLSEHINTRFGKEIIPRNIIKKVPSAELAENQFDPFDYNIVSPLVEEILENRKSFKECVAMGYEEALVERIIKLIQRSEYKRRQAAPGLRVSEKAFGTGRRMPIVNHFIDLE